MGEIIKIKTLGKGEVLVEVKLNYEEILKLKGNIKNVYLFSEEASEVTATLSQRGKNEATKYFLIPRNLREDLNFDEEVKCQRIETGSGIVFIYCVDKGFCEEE